MLITLQGVIVDFELAPTNATDLAVGEELLTEHTDLTVLGDKGYVSAPVTERLQCHNRIQLLALRCKNQKTQLPAAVKNSSTKSAS
jgi:hypothetical protein